MTYKFHEIKVEKCKFDSINIGDLAEFTHKITHNDIDIFASLTGDFNPLHISQEFAKSTSFQKPVVHGMLSASFISTIIGTKLPGEGALWLSQTLEFLLPAFVGDTILIQSKVINKSASTQSLVLDTKIKNQHNQILITGTSTVKMVNVDNSIEENDDIAGSKNLSLKISKPYKIEDNNQEVKRTVLVTGGTGGIGKAIVTKLAENGFNVVVNYNRNESQSSELIQFLSSKGHVVIDGRADVSKLDDLDKLKSKIENSIGIVTDVVHCAAIGPIPTPFKLLEWNDFQKQIDIQLKGAFNCTKIFLPPMLEFKKGTFTYISSIFAEGIPPTSQAHYVSTKAALSAFARSIAVEYGNMGIRSNIIAPGLTKTEMISSLPEKTKLLTKINTPLRKIAAPDDIANVVKFIISDSSSHITGETIRVCGGIVM